LSETGDEQQQNSEGNTETHGFDLADRGASP
jgi:hypothetical protein